MSSSNVLTGSVEGGIEGDAVLPASPDDTQPGSGEDADRVRVAAAALDGLPVDGRGPRVPGSAAVGEVHHRGAELLVARPAEHGAFLLA